MKALRKEAERKATSSESSISTALGEAMATLSKAVARDTETNRAAIASPLEDALEMIRSRGGEEAGVVSQLATLLPVLKEENGTIPASVIPALVVQAPSRRV